MERFFSVKEDQHLISIDNEILTSVEISNKFELCQYLPGTVGTGSMREIRLKPGMNLYIEDLNPQKDLLSSLEAKQFPLKFLFTIHGKVRIKNELTGYEEILRSGQSSLSYTTHPVKGSMEKKADERTTLVTILMEPEVFLEFIGEDFDQLPRDLRYLIERKNKSDYHETTRQTSEMSQALNQIITCSYKGLTRRLFLESKAIEIIACQLECLSRGDSCPYKCQGFLSKDIDKIYQARDILVQKMEDPPGLFEIAKTVGLSHTYLNRGFHEVFNNTVFGYLRSIRMEAARIFIEEGGMNVTEAAFAVGYSSLSHFSLAFRRHTGVNPGTFIN